MDYVIKKGKYFIVVFLFYSFFGILKLPFAIAQNKPETPRIEYVVPLPKQPHNKDSSTIWYDDFNGENKKYAEGGTFLDSLVSFGGIGKSMECFYEKGKKGIGGGKVFFGDSPTYNAKTVRKDRKFNEIYWRIYVKHQYGWTGAPAKMSRATSMVSSSWAQAMIAHVWSGAGSSLTLDPVCGVQGDNVVTRRYNDFERMKWLGNKPNSRFPIHASDESGYWILVESRAKLNTPGKSDGINQLWIDGNLECERRNLNFRGNYTEHGINAVFLEAYWNDGSPVSQSRWYDNFIISTEPIGPVFCSVNPKIVKTPFRGSGKSGSWEFELATDRNGKNIVYKSNKLAPFNESIINIKNGRFIGIFEKQDKLNSGTTYYLRVRQSNEDGIFSEWSRWHQSFKVAPS